MLEYYYDLFGNYYHKKEKITQQEYIKQTKETIHLINKLKYSIWPFQHNDFVFLKLPNYDKEMNIPLYGKSFYDFLISRNINVIKSVNYYASRFHNSVYFTVKDNDIKNKLKDLNLIFLKTQDPNVEKDLKKFQEKYSNKLRVININNNETIIDMNLKYRDELYYKLNLHFCTFKTPIMYKEIIS